jgi:hypothetical protein
VSDDWAIFFFGDAFLLLLLHAAEYFATWTKHTHTHMDRQLHKYSGTFSFPPYHDAWCLQGE